MTLRDAVKQKVRRLRDRKWADDDTYMLLLYDSRGELELVSLLYAPRAQKLLGYETPQIVNTSIFQDWDEDDNEIYTGPVFDEGSIPAEGRP